MTQKHKHRASHVLLSMLIPREHEESVSSAIPEGAPVVAEILEPEDLANIHDASEVGRSVGMAFSRFLQPKIMPHVKHLILAETWEKGRELESSQGWKPGECMILHGSNGSCGITMHEATGKVMLHTTGNVPEHLMKAALALGLKEPTNSA